jgi:hypothetical protein
LWDAMVVAADGTLSTAQFTASFTEVLNVAAANLPADTWRPARFAQSVGILANKLPAAQIAFRDALLAAVQATASESATSAINVGTGGVVTLGGPGITITIPALAFNKPARDFASVDVHVYDCKFVRSTAEGAPNQCFSVSPHSYLKPVQVIFPTSATATRCTKSNDELTGNWQFVDCGLDAQVATYTSSELSVFAAVDGPASKVLDPRPAGKVSLVQLPQLVYPASRFHRTGKHVARGQFSEFRSSQLANKFLSREPERDETVTGLAIDEENQRVYWSDGRRIRVQHVRDRIDGVSLAPPSVENAAIELRIWGQRLGTSTLSIMTIKVDSIYTCTVRAPVSREVIVCDILNAPDHLVSIAAEHITRRNVVVFMVNHHRLTEDEAPAITHVQVNVNARAPRALACFNDAQFTAVRYLCWADANLRQIVCATVKADTGKLEHKRIVVSDTGPSLVQGIVLSRSSDGAFRMYYTIENSIRVIDNVLRETELESSRLLTDQVNEPRGLALDSDDGLLYVAEATGRVVSVRIDALGQQVDPNQPEQEVVRLVLTRPSHVRLHGIALYTPSSSSTDSTKQLYWTEKSPNAIMRATVRGTQITTMLGVSDVVQTKGWSKGLVFPHDVIVSGEKVYWSEILGEVVQMNVDASEAVTLVERAVSGAARSMSAEVESMQKRGVDYHIVSVSPV